MLDDDERTNTSGCAMAHKLQCYIQLRRSSLLKMSDCEWLYGFNLLYQTPSIHEVIGVRFSKFLNRAGIHEDNVFSGLYVCGLLQ